MKNVKFAKKVISLLLIITIFIGCGTVLAIVNETTAAAPMTPIEIREQRAEIFIILFVLFLIVILVWWL